MCPIVEREDDGRLLSEGKCVSCQNGTQPSADKSQCLPCKQLPMLTPGDLTDGHGCNCRCQFIPYLKFVQLGKSSDAFKIIGIAVSIELSPMLRIVPDWNVISRRRTIRYARF